MPSRGPNRWFSLLTFSREQDAQMLELLRLRQRLTSDPEGAFTIFQAENSALDMEVPTHPKPFMRDCVTLQCSLKVMT